MFKVLKQNSTYPITWGQPGEVQLARTKASTSLWPWSWLVVLCVRCIAKFARNGIYFRFSWWWATDNGAGIKPASIQVDEQRREFIIICQMTFWCIYNITASVWPLTLS